MSEQELIRDVKPELKNQKQKLISKLKQYSRHLEVLSIVIIVFIGAVQVLDTMMPTSTPTIVTTPQPREGMPEPEPEIDLPVPEPELSQVNLSDVMTFSDSVDLTVTKLNGLKEV